MELPIQFKEMMAGLLGGEAADFFRAMDKPPVVSVRLNGRKPSDAFAGSRRVKWCARGYYLDSRPVFTLDPLLHAGAYYVQDASSMIHYTVARRIAARLQDEMGSRSADLRLRVLDMCAAPGGKTTAMIDALPDGTEIVANEYVSRRAGILRENIAKWGYPDVSVTNCDSARFARNGDTFDIVAVDAPCSGEGMMRKEPEAVAQWSPELVERCASLQREILANAAATVAPGGFLIYSTCTFNHHENEENAAYIRDTLGLEPFDPEFPDEWGIAGGIDTDLPVFRFMPHITEGEGLFLAVFRRPGNFEPRPAPRRVALPKGKGALRCHDVPPVEDILSVDFDRNAWPVAELDLDRALAYLRRESVTVGPEVPKGIVVMAYKGLLLGPAKNIGSRVNNLYPKNWRILMR